jgi:hypothetical protein
VPYQLHCDTAAAQEDSALLDEMDTTLDELDGGVLLGAELELEGVDDTELVEPEHTLPVIAGISAVEPCLSPCTPKLTDCPGWILLFQFKALAE